MRKILLLLMLLPFLGWSQKTHKVAPKETLFSIGRQYNIHPRELAEYNNIPFETGLTIGQVLKIPSKTTMAPLAPVENATKDNSTIEIPVVKKEEKPKPAKLVPVYHKVQKKENLYQISRLYNKVPVDDLKKWNKLTSDGLTEGTNLIVGYTGEGKVTGKTITEKPVKAVEPVVETKPPPPVEKPVPVAEKKDENVTPQIIPTHAADFKGGVFRNLFESQVKGNEVLQEEGTAGVFKSTSGWNDGKYYCLHNDIAAGTVIKVTNKANGMSIYAKVLDVIPDIKQNSGLIIRISNAASEVLGAAGNNFDCILNYSK